MDLPLQGRVALVTGAGKRLGRAVALRLAEEGGDVVVHYRSSQPEACETVKQIEKLGRRASAIGANLGRVSEIKRLFDEAGKHFGRLDILVNSAANFLPASMVSTTEEIWDSSLDTNLRAPFFCVQAAAPWLHPAFHFESWRDHVDESAGEGAGAGSAGERHRSGNHHYGRRSAGVGSRLYQAGAAWPIRQALGHYR